MDFGVAALVRALIKALEAQGRGFAHGHEKHHSEPKTKAIDIIQMFLGCRRTGAADHGRDSIQPDHGHGSGAADHIAEETLSAWMDAHSKASLHDAATKQYGSTVEVCQVSWMLKATGGIHSRSGEAMQTRWRRR